ncbi:MAG: 2'-5' RNA ligase [Pseudomonadales bacterium]
MNQDFINTGTTTAWDDIDFHDWHGGVEYYGFWALIIEDSEWLKVVSEAASCLSPYVHKEYRRQPHVSIIAGGLMSEQYYSPTIINKHKQALLQASMPSFSIRLVGLDSFTSAPYLTVADTDGGLDCLRKQLLAIASEDNLENYQPHITLGLYKDEFFTIAIGETMSAFNMAMVKPHIVTEVKFCSYQTNDIQGRITVLDSIELNSK